MRIKVPEIEMFQIRAVEIYDEILFTDKRHACLIIAKALLNEYGKGADATAANTLEAIESRINELRDKQ